MINDSNALNNADFFAVKLPQQANRPNQSAGMGLSRRQQTYIHPSWLAKALAGDRQCMFSLHTQANYSIPKADNGFDAQGYKLKHQAALTQYAKELKTEGYTVYTEGSNDFKYETKFGAIISAKPDIVAVRADEVIVPDIKAGKELKASDIAQVKLYMALIPTVGLHGIREIPAGQLVHKGEIFDISPAEITIEFKRQVAELVKDMKTANTPPVTPSVQECRWCPLRHLCPDRLEIVAKGTDGWL
ncbi:PD-(D/E)XK nuclease family protein [Pelatocladus sp. BLCC-F211]|uniref:PD-(D/E)XK nuclease family protein n=1 Tax=Pelatocladus sp. BLCC-F211 TaxID=3342752 RepID=UPI0035B94F62